MSGAVGPSAATVEQRADDAATVSCLMNLLQLWPLTVDLHHRLHTRADKSSRQRIDALEVALVQSLSQSILPLTLKLLQVAQQDNPRLPQALNARLLVFLLRSLELYVERRPKETSAVLLRVQGVTSLMALYRSGAQRGGPVRTSLYFLLVAILTSQEEGLQAALLVQSKLWESLLSELVAATRLNGKRVPAQCCRLVALSLILPISNIREMISKDTRVPTMLKAHPMVYERLRESVQLKDYSLKYTDDDPVALLESWKTHNAGSLK